MAVLDSHSASLSHMSHVSRRGKLPGTWKHRGPGEVIVVPALRDSPCMRNCSERGAVCVALDRDGTARGGWTSLGGRGWQADPHTQ